MGSEVENPIERIAERERAQVGNRDGDRHREAERSPQAGEGRQIDAEGAAVDRTKADKPRCDDGSEPERQPSDKRLTPGMESAGQA